MELWSKQMISKGKTLLRSGCEEFWSKMVQIWCVLQNWIGIWLVVLMIWQRGNLNYNKMEKVGVGWDGMGGLSQKWCTQCVTQCATHHSLPWPIARDRVHRLRSIRVASNHNFFSHLPWNRGQERTKNGDFKTSYDPALFGWYEHVVAVQRKYHKKNLTEWIRYGCGKLQCTARMIPVIILLRLMAIQ